MFYGPLLGLFRYPNHHLPSWFSFHQSLTSRSIAQTNLEGLGLFKQDNFSKNSQNRPFLAFFGGVFPAGLSYIAFLSTIQYQYNTLKYWDNTIQYQYNTISTKIVYNTFSSNTIQYNIFIITYCNIYKLVLSSNMYKK